MKNISVCILLALIILTTLSGCSLLPICTNTKKENSYPKENGKSEQASVFFENGKQGYMHFKFNEAIKFLQSAINCETSGTKKAQIFIYLGATYFYKNDIQSAKNCFSQAKKNDSKVEPSRSDFPREIINLFRNSY